MELIDQKISSNLKDLLKINTDIRDGENIILNIYLSQNLTEDQLSAIENELVSKSVKLINHIKQDANILSISFTK
jgi:hypothetical protein